MPYLSTVHMRHRAWLLAAVLACPTWAAASGEKIGDVDTAFKWLGRDHDIVVEAYDDPHVQGVSCYVSRARTGGIKGSLGLAEDRSRGLDRLRSHRAGAVCCGAFAPAAGGV